MSTKKTVSVRARKFDEPKSEKQFEIDKEDFNEDTIADQYVNRFVKMIHGSVIFVETSYRPFPRWILWRVECVMTKPMVGYFTAQATEQEARYEIAKHQAKPS